jgi:hypothetical protein
MAKRLALFAGLGFRPRDTEAGVRMFLTMGDLEASFWGNAQRNSPSF